MSFIMSEKQDPTFDGFCDRLDSDIQTHPATSPPSIVSETEDQVLSLKTDLLAAENDQLEARLKLLLNVAPKTTYIEDKESWTSMSSNLRSQLEQILELLGRLHGSFKEAEELMEPCSTERLSYLRERIHSFLDQERTDLSKEVKRLQAAFNSSISFAKKKLKLVEPEGRSTAVRESKFTDFLLGSKALAKRLYDAKKRKEHKIGKLMELLEESNTFFIRYRKELQQYADDGTTDVNCEDLTILTDTVEFALYCLKVLVTPWSKGVAIALLRKVHKLWNWEQM